jgi:hypothetical protein
MRQMSNRPCPAFWRSRKDSGNVYLPSFYWVISVGHRCSKSCRDSLNPRTDELEDFCLWCLGTVVAALVYAKSIILHGRLNSWQLLHSVPNPHPIRFQRYFARRTKILFQPSSPASVVLIRHSLILHSLVKGFCGAYIKRSAFAPAHLEVQSNSQCPITPRIYPTQSYSPLLLLPMLSKTCAGPPKFRLLALFAAWRMQLFRSSRLAIRSNNRVCAEPSV